MELIIGSLNILSPFYAVKWFIPQGLHPLAYTQTRRILRKSLCKSDRYAWKKYSNWEKRCPILAGDIIKADLICLQEVSAETLDDITALTPCFKTALLACHRSKDPVSQYGNAILYNPEKLKPESAFEIRYSINAIQRSACCAIFTCQNKRLLVSSIHLRGYDPDQTEGDFKEASKKTGFCELKTYVEELEKKADDVDFIVIAGDFNEAIEGKRFSLSRLGYLEERGYFTDENMEPSEVGCDRKIDWIFFKTRVSKGKIALRPMNFEKQPVPISDHLMVGTCITWNE